jgi:UDP-2-acetamido-2-deoxy-ribo-hexuluronate aminotransferase
MEFIDLKSQYRALRKSIDKRIDDVLAHGQFILGPEVRELESRLQEFTGCRHCVTTASGTDALLMALMALDVGPGDEVITTPFTFVATVEAIALRGARAVFVDVEAETGNIDAGRIESAITPRTRAIMPVALYGQPADMTEINAIAQRHGLPVVEDAAQSLGAKYLGRRSCNLSTVGCTSFYPSKPLGCYGDGGAIFTNDPKLAEAMRQLRAHGQEEPFQYTRVGLNGRMDTIQCAIVLAKLERFDWELHRRAAIAQRYDQLLRALEPVVRLLEVKPDRTSAYAQYTIRVRERDQVQKRLAQAGIPTAVHYRCALHTQPAYSADHLGESYPFAEQMAREVLSLPMHPELDEPAQDRIVDALRQAATTPAGAG